MSMFDVVTFNPQDVKAVAAGVGTRAQVLAILTSQTCGEACWHAREDVCRCSCGGKNHGCLNHGGERPERHSKIDGVPYRLGGVGPWRSLYDEAKRINGQQYARIDRVTYVIDGIGAGYSLEQWQAAKAEGKECFVSQYYGIWRETDSGAPARIKYPSASQRKWIEFSAFNEDREAALLWVRLEMPAKPLLVKVDRNGNPEPKQFPGE